MNIILADISAYDPATPDGTVNLCPAGMANATDLAEFSADAGATIFAIDNGRIHCVTNGSGALGFYANLLGIPIAANTLYSAGAVLSGLGTVNVTLKTYTAGGVPLATKTVSAVLSAVPQRVEVAGLNSLPTAAIARIIIRSTTATIVDIYADNFQLEARAQLTGLRTLHYATAPGYNSLPTATPANTYYEPRLLQPGSFRVDMFGQRTTGGSSEVGYGAIELANADGALDPLLDYGFAGWPIVIREVTPSGIALISTGTMEQPEFSSNGSLITLRRRNYQALLEQPVQPIKYLGNNALPAGIEGGEDLAGKRKPLTYGQVHNISPVLVNTWKLVYQAHSGVLAAIGKASDRGIVLVGTELITNGDFAAAIAAPWTAGAGWVRNAANNTMVRTAGAATNLTHTLALTVAKNYYLIYVDDVICASAGGTVTVKIGGTVIGTITVSGHYEFITAGLAGDLIFVPDATWAGSIDNVSVHLAEDFATSGQLLASSPPAGGYHTCLAEGLLMLGIPATGQVTCNATEGTAAADRTVAQIAKRIVAPTFLASADLVQQGFIDLDKANASEVGIYITGEETTAEVLDQLFGTIGAWSDFSNTGKYNARRLEIPTAGAILTLDDSQIMDIERLAAKDEGSGVPAWEMVLTYLKNYTVQKESDLATSVTPTRRQWLGQESRTVTSTDATVKTANKNSPTLHRATLFVRAADGQAESDRLLTMNKVRRDPLRVGLKREALRYVDGGFWDDEAVADLASGRYRHTSVVYNGFLYVIGGYVSGITSASVIRLDLTNPTGAWDDAGVTDLPFARTFHTAVVCNNYLYVIGGDVSGSTSASVIRLDLTNPGGAWVDAGVTDLPFARGSHASVVYNGFLYVIGGDTGSYTSSVMRLDLTNPTGAWDDAGVTDLPLSRAFHTGVVYNNYLYVIGGTVGGILSASVIRLDLTNPVGAWDDAGVTNLPFARNSHASVVHNGFLFVIGGYVTDCIAAVIRLDLSNPTGVWDDAGVTDLPAIRALSAAIEYNGNIYLTGGWTPTPQANTYLYRSNDNPDDVNHIYDVGRVVKLAITRYGYGGNKLMRIIGYEIDHELATIDLYLWG